MRIRSGTCLLTSLPTVLVKLCNNDQMECWDSKALQDKGEHAQCWFRRADVADDAVNNIAIHRVFSLSQFLHWILVLVYIRSERSPVKGIVFKLKNGRTSAPSAVSFAHACLCARWRTSLWIVMKFNLKTIMTSIVQARATGSAIYDYWKTLFEYKWPFFGCSSCLCVTVPLGSGTRYLHRGKLGSSANRNVW